MFGGNKYFHFRGSQTIMDEELIVKRCSHIINNSRCKKRVQIGLDMCWIHLLKVKRLRIKKSTVNNHNSGLGLFAEDSKVSNNAVIFVENQEICKYHGEKIDLTQLLERYGDNTAPYSIERTIHRNKPLFEDAAAQRGVGSIINHMSQENRVNAGFRRRCNIGNNHIPEIVVVALKPIRNGREILVSYGPEYIMNEPGSINVTNTRVRNL